MRTIGDTGRISHGAFTISTSVLFGAVTIALVIRLYTRLRVQRGFATDDALLAAAFCCILAAFIILHAVALDDMFLVEAVPKNVPRIVLPSDFLRRIERFNNVWITTILLLTWLAIMAIKFSFLLFFRKLIDRIRPLVWYWCFVVIYNIGVLGFGIATYFIGCPHRAVLEAIQCVNGSFVERVMALSISQILLDIIGDFMILYIPVRLIWGLQVSTKQKFHLTLSLCLTAVLIVITVIRVAGFKDHGQVDVVWETYWFMVSAQIGVLVGAATSLRSLFVARSQNTASTAHQQLERIKSQSNVENSVRAFILNRNAVREGYDPLRTPEGHEIEYGIPGVAAV